MSSARSRKRGDERGIAEKMNKFEAAIWGLRVPRNGRPRSPVEATSLGRKKEQQRTEKEQLRRKEKQLSANNSPAGTESKYVSGSIQEFGENEKR